MSDAFPVRVLDGLQGLASQYGLALDERGKQFLAHHCETLCRWNLKMNLVGDWSVETAVYRHYGESLFLASVMGEKWEVAVDFGSGAGFPGIGLIALSRERVVYLSEARLKRAAFLREATRGCGYAKVFAGDCEDLPGNVDIVVSRAVDIGVVVRFAVKRGAYARILMSASDGDRWRGDLSGLGWSCSVEAVPWRPESVVLVGRPVESLAGAETV